MKTQKKYKNCSKDPEHAVYPDCSYVENLHNKLPMMNISKGMLNMNSVSMQHKVPEIQKNLKKQDIPSDVSHCFSNLQTQNKLVKHIDLALFKTTECLNNDEHLNQTCPFYHSSEDKRRQRQYIYFTFFLNRQGTHYSGELCQNIKNESQCPQQDSCIHSHNMVEQLYLSCKYKTKFCKFYPDQLVNCEYNIFCPFAHSEEEIKSELLTNFERDTDFYMFLYKTSCCAYLYIQHQWADCPYAHNYGEWRRKIQKNYYEPEICKTWQDNPQLQDQSRCSMGLACTYTHTQNEYDYHPKIYKTRQCNLNQNCHDPQCPYYHSDFDKRTIDPMQQFGIFKVVPRNRIVEKTFKTRIQPQQTSTKQYQNKCDAQNRKLMTLNHGAQKLCSNQNKYSIIQ